MLDKWTVGNGPLGETFEQISDLPLDDPPPVEGDDRIHDPNEVTHRVGAERVTSLVAAPAKPRIFLVPFTRTLTPGKSSGSDVVAVQRALSRAGYRKGAPSGYFGPLMLRQMKSFQHDHGIPASGVYGLATHRALMKWFDAYGAHLMQVWKAKHDAQSHRQLVVAAAMFGVAHRQEIAYSMLSHRLDFMRDGTRPPKVPAQTDCSGFACWTYFVPKFADPCGGDWNPAKLHYTGTLSKNGKSVNEPMPGDLLLYGNGYPYEHVTIAVDSERCVSNGSDPGPLLLPHSYRSDLASVRSFLPR